MRHLYLVLQIVLATLLFNGCALFGDKKKKELTPAQLEQARQYIAQHPNGIPVQISAADRQTITQMAGQMRDSTPIKKLLLSNPKYADWIAQKEAKPVADEPLRATGPRKEVVTQRYTGGAR